MQEEEPANRPDEPNARVLDEEATGSSADEAKEREREMEESGEENPV